jgi:hypothetical protein
LGELGQARGISLAGLALALYVQGRRRHPFFRETVESLKKNYVKKMIFSRCFDGLGHLIQEKEYGETVFLIN